MKLPKGVVMMKDFIINLEDGMKGLYTGTMKKSDKTTDNEDGFIPHGKGKCLFDNGVKYEGEFCDG